MAGLRRIGTRIVDIHCPKCGRVHQIPLEKMLGLIRHECVCGISINLDFEGTLTRTIVRANQRLDRLASMLEDMAE